MLWFQLCIADLWCFSATSIGILCYRAGKIRKSMWLSPTQLECCFHSPYILYNRWVNLIVNSPKVNIESFANSADLDMHGYISVPVKKKKHKPNWNLNVVYYECIHYCNFSLLEQFQECSIILKTIKKTNGQRHRFSWSLSPDFGGMSRFGAFLHVFPVWWWNMPKTGFLYVIFSPTNHFSIYLSNLPCYEIGWYLYRSYLYG